MKLTIDQLKSEILKALKSHTTFVWPSDLVYDVTIATKANVQLGEVHGALYDLVEDKLVLQRTVANPRKFGVISTTYKLVNR